MTLYSRWFDLVGAVGALLARRRRRRTARSYEVGVHMCTSYIKVSGPRTLGSGLNWSFAHGSGDFHSVGRRLWFRSFRIHYDPFSSARPLFSVYEKGRCGFRAQLRTRSSADSSRLPTAAAAAHYSRGYVYAAFGFQFTCAFWNSPFLLPRAFGQDFNLWFLVSYPMLSWVSRLGQL